MVQIRIQYTVFRNIYSGLLGKIHKSPVFSRREIELQNVEF
ncbi:uncharacterized protein METZ01_LOCUS120251 [marine metagenome]|uniref:Uncharacterized protein n=1 Tax=marine metagenome TaxID=408172 RepID=A0A381XT70_9ZZZZ